MTLARIGKSFSMPAGKKSGYDEVLTLDDPTGWGVRGSWAGTYVGEDTQLQLSTSFQAIRLISETIATLPLSVYRKKDGYGEADNTHKLSKLMGYRPNNFMDSVQFIESIAVGLVCQGHSYSFKQMAGNQVFSVTPLLKSRVIPRVDGNRILYTVTDEKGVQKDYTDREILSIRGFGGVNQLEGYAPHKLHRQTLATTMAAEAFVGNYFGKGGHMGGFIETDSSLKKENLDAWHKNFASRHSSPEDAHRYILLTKGMTAKPRDAGDAQSEMNATRGHQVAEIARVYNVPTSLLMDMSRATWSNSEAQSLQFYKQTLTPYLVRIEKALNTQLIPENQWGEYYFKFNVEGLLRGDSASRANFYQTMRSASLMTIDEGRSKENLPPIGSDNGGDDVHVQLNMAPAGKLASIQQPNQSEGEE